MSFVNKVREFSSLNVDEYCSSVTPVRIQQILSKRRLDEMDFLALLSDAAVPFLEQMACKARDLTRAHFGNVIFLFTPLYISNICDNVCAYCSFAHQHKIKRKHLKSEEIRLEAERIASTGLRHILVLTGESHKAASLEYLKESVLVLRDYFSSIAIEVYPLTQEAYGELITCGVDGLTIYQEAYDEPLYRRLHAGGPKADYEFRVDAPERACSEGMRSVTVGALLGLAEPRKETFFTALHAQYLQNKYPATEVSASFPRLRPLAGEFKADYEVNDRQYVQFMTAFRLFMPSAGITVSTRESESFRNSILPMGPTKMSAGVSTSVGGHSDDPSDSQFEIADDRSVEQMKRDLLSFGFQPVMHDWNYSYTRI